MSLTDRFPFSLRRSFSASTLNTAERAARVCTVEDATFFRTAFSATVVERNVRRYPVELVIAGDGTIDRPRCSCTQRFRTADYCWHLALALGQFIDDSGRLASERFSESLWRRVGESLYAAPEFSSCDQQRTADAFVTLAAGRPILSLRVDLSRGDELDRRLMHLYGRDSKAIVTVREERLRSLVMTEQERALARRGAASRRQQWERSFWYRWSRFAFDHFAGDPVLLRDEDRFLLEAAGDGIGATVHLSSAAVEEVVAHEEGVIAIRSGFAVRPEPVTPSLRLEFDDGGNLHFHPVLMLEDEWLERRPPAVERHGRFDYVSEHRAFVMVSRTRLFSEASEGQRDLLFGSRARAGGDLPVDRSTVLSAAEVFAFLDHHREALAKMPEVLLPESLRGSAAVRGADRTIFRFGPTEAEIVRLSVDYLFGEQRVDFRRIEEARREGRRAVHAGRVWIDAADPQFAWMDGLDGSSGGEWLELSRLDYLRIRSFVRGAAEFEGDESARPVWEMFEQMRGAVAAPSMGELGLDLYGYQQTGFQWLWFLQQNDFGGLLCDDMGLGKTHQAMALIRALTLDDAVGRRVLIVCPTSLLDHWREKIEQHMPGLDVHLHYGPNRTRAVAPVVITTYGTVRNAPEELAGERFDLLIADEIQSVKNRSTATHQALAAIPRRIAIGLTGTPLENRVGDLKTLLDFVVPGYLPGDAQFERLFSRPIEQGSSHATERLHHLTAPFILRRTKAQVLPELPEKILDRRYCELTPDQKDLYRQVVGSQGKEIRGLIARGETLRYTHVFAALNYLKQICDHPAIFGESAAGVSSGKWELYRELLDEALDSGLKVVVFSQYVRMLKLIERDLEARDIGFATIKGETRNRGAMVERFRSDPDCRVFTASLRAGGVGIDLTAGSVVIHYDRWWNQAREDQATDRVHRIGQTRGVQVIKLITRGTIEEKIDRIIEAKGRLASGLVREDDPTQVKQFSLEEIDEMFAWTG